MRTAYYFLVALMCLAPIARSQILQMEQLNTQQISSLDRSKTVIIIPGGILEEHGPYLPAFTDGYSDQAYSDDLARAIVARRGWAAVKFPQIPLGSNPANEIGGKGSFPGSYTVRTTTLRSVYMDLADCIGAQGFRWVFVIHNHLGPANNFALDQAGDYFHDIYGGQMVHLLGLSPISEATFVVQRRLLTASQFAENGIGIHADASEHGDVLFLHPELVSPEYLSAPSVTAATMKDAVRLAQLSGWPGYVGAPRYATVAQGAMDYTETMNLVREYALKIIDGFDYHSVPRYSDHPLTGGPPAGVPASESEPGDRQQAWIVAHNGRSVGTSPPK